nr:DUF6443 domain-containing protein [uncultured Psychroserpens sp.]
MKTVITTIAFVLVSALVLAQTATENYVKTTTYKVKTDDGLNQKGTTVLLTDDNKIETITYLDGLGRPKQSIAKQAGGNKENIVTPFMYDILGRQVKEYLPTYNTLTTTALNVLDNTILVDTDIKNYYHQKYTEELWATVSDVNAYSEKTFEASPLNRVLEQASPGEDWKLGNEHTIRLEYQTNTFDIANPTNANNDNVILFDVSHVTVNGFDEPVLAFDGHYYSSELYKTITKDENWDTNDGNNHTTEEFKNKQGQVILKRTYSDSDLNSNGTIESNEEELSHDTYYVYDDLGNLTFVLSPEGSDNILDTNNAIVQTVLDKFCYQYRYDERNRLVEKKIPQKDWEYIVYDVLDRPVLTQDANLRTNDDWLFTKYDKLDRVIYTGKHNFTPPDSHDNSGRLELQEDVDAAIFITEDKLSITTDVYGTDVYYTNRVIPSEYIDVYTINYYDDYEWDASNPYEASYNLDETTNLTELNNTLEKSTTSSSWDAGFVSEGKIVGDGFIQWTVPDTDHRVVVGLTNESGTPNDSGLNTINYGLYTRGTTNRVLIRENGFTKNIATTYYQPGDVFKVERSGTQILYKQNGVVVASSEIASTGVLVGDSSFYDPNTIIEDVHIGYSALGQNFTQSTTGLATGSLVRVLGTSNWIINRLLYDEKGRAIHTNSENEYLVTSDVSSNLLDFVGKNLKTHQTHRMNSKNPIVLEDNFIYDHQDRLIRQVQKINNDSYQLIAKQNYDELGQLKMKQVGAELLDLGTYVNNTGLNVSGNIITKNTGTNGAWDRGLTVQEHLDGDGYVSFAPYRANYTFACGLSYTTDFISYTNIRYAIQINSSGAVSIHESGTNLGDKTNYVAGDIFMVERRGDTIFYLKNGEVFYVSTVQTSGNIMRGDVAIYSRGGKLKNLVVVNLEDELQEVDYVYNVRGWLKEINDVDNLGNDLFGFKLNYNTKENNNSKVLFNGNISETYWSTASEDPSTILLESQIKRGYSYNYDALNRILTADFEKTSGENQTLLYDLSVIGYDKNGNINALKRTGVNDSGQFMDDMDSLTYSYDGNQLTDILESGNNAYGFKEASVQSTDYTYDANGNMTQDLNKKIASISYNHLNLPTFIVSSDSNEGHLYYIYDATGVKLEKRVEPYSGTITATYYAGNYIYEKTGTEEALKFFSQPEGYIEPNTNGGFDYTYQYKDHLGNIRLAYNDSNSDGSISTSEIIEENNYYPFGLKHKGYNNVINGAEYKYKTYQGQEISEELGYNMLEFKYRHYDPSTGRFFAVDPLAEHYSYNSTYAFQENKLGLGVELEGLEMVQFPVYGKDVTSVDLVRTQEASRVANTVAAVGQLAMVAPVVVSAVGTETTTVFVANELKDEALSRATNGASDYLDLTKMAWKGLKNLAEFGAKKLFGKADNVAGALSSSVDDAKGAFTKSGGAGKLEGLKIDDADGDFMQISGNFDGTDFAFQGNISVSDGVLTIDGGDFEGALGVSGFREALASFGKASNVEKVVFNSGKRTTGANPGKVISVEANVKDYFE